MLRILDDRTGEPVPAAPSRRGLTRIEAYASGLDPTALRVLLTADLLSRALELSGTPVWTILTAPSRHAELRAAATTLAIRPFEHDRDLASGLGEAQAIHVTAEPTTAFGEGPVLRVAPVAWEPPPGRVATAPSTSDDDSEHAPGRTPEPAADHASGSGSGSGSDSDSGIGPSGSGIGPSGSGSAAGRGPGAAPGRGPEPAAGRAPGSAADRGSEAAAERAAEPPRDHAAEQASGYRPGHDPEPAAGREPGSAAGRAADSAPGRVPRSAAQPGPHPGPHPALSPLLLADPEALRLALLAVPRGEAVPLDPGVLGEAAAWLGRWRGAVAGWARRPSRPVPEAVRQRLRAAWEDDLDLPGVLDVLRDVESDPELPDGARFETFVYADRLLALDLARDLGRLA